jgi:hypothetical protein
MFELYKWNGPMPPIMCDSTEQRDFFIEKLMSFEDDLHKCESSLAVESSFRRVFAYASQDISTWHDWGIVLATNRMRKLGDKESAQKMLEKLKFSGYRFNTRRNSG